MYEGIGREVQCWGCTDVRRLDFLRDEVGGELFLENIQKMQLCRSFGAEESW